jgi:hypothetical protein
MMNIANRAAGLTNSGHGDGVQLSVDNAAVAVVACRAGIEGF